jgi:hypothetical protein
MADAIRESLPLPLVADFVRFCSQAISAADGAGDAGWLSPIQATQIAALIYDSTVDLVVTRFNGNVTRFKAVLAIVIIAMSKGPVHAAAIRARIAERARPAPLLVDAAADALTNGQPAFDPTYLEALRRQNELRQTGRAE